MMMNQFYDDMIFFGQHWVLDRPYVIGKQTTFLRDVGFFDFHEPKIIEKYGKLRFVSKSIFNQTKNHNHDICIYCGADNGINGEFRHGWDCHACQSN